MNWLPGSAYFLHAEYMIKLETIHWQRNLTQKLSSTASNDIAVNLKKEDSKDYNSVDNIKQEKSLTKINSYAQDNTLSTISLGLKIDDSNQKLRIQ